jgi:hypothetical protein
VSAVNPSEHEAVRWIKETLAAAGVSVDVYADVIPTEASVPAIRVTCQSRNDTRTNAQHIAISTWRFLVVGVDFDHELEAVVARSKAIDAALHEASGSTADLRVVACTRVQTYSAPSYERGDLYRLSGGVYEVVGAAAA